MRVTSKWPSNGNSSVIIRKGTLTVSRPLASLHAIIPFCQNQQFATHRLGEVMVRDLALYEAASQGEGGELR
jgi:hypothetical protein